MSEKRNVTLRTYTFDPEDQRRLLEDTIQDWQAAGPAAIWRATWELTVSSYLLRGVDIRNRPMERSHVERRTAPWTNGALDSFGKDFDT